MVKKLERSVEGSFTRACKNRKVWCIKFGIRALPDVFVLLRTGRIVFVEFKRPGEKPRPNQKARIRKLRKFNFQVEVVDNNAEALALAKTLSEENNQASRQR